MSGGLTVFLDRDGVIIEEQPFQSRPEELRLIRGAAEAVARLNRAGARVIVVTNQSGVARGLFTEADLERFHEHLRAELARFEARLDAVYWSPFHPEAEVERYRRHSDCRKPGPGMFARAIRELGLDNDARYVIGDRLTDLEAGKSVGCIAVLVRTGHGEHNSQLAKEHGLVPDHVADDLAAAAEWILARHGTGRA